MKSKCATIILNWNGSTDTIACIKSIIDNPEDQTDLIIIDNNSDCEQYNTLREYIFGLSVVDTFANPSFPNNAEVEQSDLFHKRSLKIYLIRMKTNYGFSKACNAGAYLAEQLGYQYILFLNNDTEVTDGFLQSLIGELEAKREVIAVIPQIRYFHNKNKIWNCGGDISKYGNRKYFYANADYRNISDNVKKININFATGCCILFRTKEFLTIGMFTEKFFFGEEDIELALRLKLLNKKMLCDMNSIIYHKVGASISGDQSKLLRKAYIHYLNRLVNMKAYLGAKWYIWMLPSVVKIMLNIIRLNKVSVRQFFRFITAIVLDAYKSESVDKAKFEKILRDGF